MAALAGRAEEERMRKRQERARGRREQENGAERESSRTVLRREKAIILPDGVDEVRVLEVLKSEKLTAARVGDMWRVVDEVQAPDARRAIEAHAGKPGTPDAKPGVYKAPPTQSWRGGQVYEAPPAPKVERRALDD